ncbi:phosphopantothenoylcysteine decarboxylase-like protein [Cricetulus griseus]|uniref:Phosphopantothenoylcysteine decarboxylase-like protein n=1 Tax=Cricetulus griseus TaxID=10029 RepID=A0A061I5D3_CRIGR|nr:phosphopantothenoylcysteine decarboxylase-like protein [Cricetulus griseus]
MWKRRSDPVLHIDLRRWADLLLVAPLDANTLGKVASGICDNLLVSDSWCLSSSLAPSLLSCRLHHTRKSVTLGRRSVQQPPALFSLAKRLKFWVRCIVWLCQCSLGVSTSPLPSVASQGPHPQPPALPSSFTTAALCVHFH